MAYCIQADIEARISAADVISLTDDTGTEAVVSATLNAAIAMADARIDAALKGRFIVPLTGTIPDLIKFISVDLTVYNLFTRRPSIEFPAIVTDRYNEALKLLADLASGALLIYDSDDAALADYSGDMLCNKEDSDRDLDDDTLDLF